MILCVEAHTSLWTTAECGLMDIMAAVKANQDRFYQYLADVPAFQNGGFAQCLGNYGEFLNYNCAESGCTLLCKHCRFRSTGF